MEKQTARGVLVGRLSDIPTKRVQETASPVPPVKPTVKQPTIRRPGDKYNKQTAKK